MLDGLALHGQFQTLVTVLAGGHEGVGAVDVGAWLVGAEQGGRKDRAAQVIFHADFLLLGHIGLERLAGIGDGSTRGAVDSGGGAALRQAFDVVGVQREVVLQLVDHTGHRAHAALVVVGRLGTGLHAPVIHTQGLVTRSDGDQQLVTQEAHRVAERNAAQPDLAGQGRAGKRAFGGVGGPVGAVVIGGGIQAGGQLVAIVELPAVLFARVVGADGTDHLVFDVARGEFGPGPHLTGDDAVLADVVEAVAGTGAVVAVDGEVGQRVVFLALAGAQGEPAGDLVVEVMLAAQGAEGVLLLRIGPRFGPVQRALRGGGDGGHGGAQRDVGAGLLQAVVLVAHIGRQAGVGVVPVQAGLQQVFLVVLVVDGRLALAMGGHHAQAGAAVRAKAAGHVGRGVELLVVHQAHVDLGQRLVGCTLGQQVDGTTQARATGRDAGQEGAGAAQHLDTLEQVGGNVLAGQQAIEAVEGDVIRVQQETAHEVGFLEVAETAGHADGRIVEQHVGHALGLLVLDQLVGVGRDRERYVHLVAGAQNAHAATTGHLATGQGFGQAGSRGVGTGTDGDDFQDLGIGHFLGMQCGGAKRQRYGRSNLQRAKTGTGSRGCPGGGVFHGLERRLKTLKRLRRNMKMRRQEVERLSAGYGADSERSIRTKSTCLQRQRQERM